MKKSLWLATVLSGSVAIANSARADALTPATFVGNVAIGATIQLSKVGTITAGAPTSARADVLFLTDTTGSMSSAISSIQTAFSSTVTSLSALGNFAFGAAEYKDQTSAGDAFDFKLDQAISTNSSLTQTALNNLTAGGGGDDPEQGLYALTQSAQAGTGFRSGAKKIVVLTGDAPSHDASNPPAPPGTTVASTASALNAAGITVEALNASNITFDSGLDSYGQFDSTTGIFADGVAGSYTSMFPSTSALTSLLTNLIGSAFSTYSDVSLNLVGATPTNCTVSLPADQIGSYDRSMTNTFNFGQVSVLGVSAGTCSFSVALEADGAILATEMDSISVVGPTPMPEPASLTLLGAGLVGLAYRKRKSPAR